MNPFIIIIAIISSIMAIVFISEAWSYPSSARDMPIIYASIVLILCVGVVIQQYRITQFNMNNKENAPKKVRITWLFNKDRLLAFVIIALTIIYVFAIQFFGYILPTIAFFFLAAAINKTVSMRATLLAIIIIVSLIGFLFIGFLRLPLNLLPGI